MSKWNNEPPVGENPHLPFENWSRALLLGEEVLGLFLPIENRTSELEF